MASSEKRSMWPKVRKFFNDIHLWAGLASGIIVIVVCFSGTIYVFNSEFREMSAPQLYEIETPGSTALSAEEIIAKVEGVTEGKVATVRIPADEARTWQVSVRKNAPAGHAGGHGGRPNRGTVYAVNPYTGEVIGDISNHKNATTEFMRMLFSLHRWLLLDRVEEPIFGELPNRQLGSYITGTATILFTLGVLTGMVIWFPQKIRNWKQGLKIKWDAKWKRINHDLHNALAFYSLIFLFLMGVTGPQWSFPWYREGLQKTLGTYRAPDAPRDHPPHSAVPFIASEPSPLTLEDYIASAGEVLPYRGDCTITLPEDSSSVIAISKNKVGFFAPAASDKVFLDQYSGAVIERDIFSEKPFNERVAASIKSLHLGDVYGMFTKILYFFACLVATSLPVTGTIIWINKLEKKRRKARKQVRTGGELLSNSQFGKDHGKAR